MINIVTDIKKIEKSQWLDFVQSHCEGSVFQTPYWYEIYDKLDNFTPIVVVAKKQENIVGVLLAIIYTEGKGLVGKLTARSVIMGGPLVRDNDVNVAELLIENYSKIVSKKAIYSQFRNLFDVSALSQSFLNNKYDYIPHLDIIHELSKPKEEITSNISKNKRKNVSKSRNKGLIFKEVENQQEIDRCIDLIQMTYKRISLPCPDKSFFYTFINSELAENILKIFAVELDGNIVGTRWELCFNGTVYDWYAGADDNFRNLYPNDVLPYNILFWSKENGFDKFDFGGAGKPNVPYGVRDHKLKFGGELVEYGRYERVHKPLLMSIGKLGLFFYKKIKKAKK